MKPFSYFLQWVKGRGRHAWRLDLVRAFPEVNRLCAVANAGLIGGLMLAAQYLTVFINYKTIQPFPSAKSGTETWAGGFIIAHAMSTLFAWIAFVCSFAILQFWVLVHWRYCPASAPGQTSLSDFLAGFCKRIRFKKSLSEIRIFRWSPSRCSRRRRSFVSVN